MSTSPTVSVRVRAPRADAFRACTDPVALAAWRSPDGMVLTVESFEGHVGGRYRMSLRYRDAGHPVPGKTDAMTDTFVGTFAEIVEGERVVEVVTFVTDDPDLSGPMTVTTTFADALDGTDVAVSHDGLPPGIDPADNELGTRQSLARLAAYLDGATPS